MNIIEDTIARVEKLYENITGKELSNEPNSQHRINSDVDPILLLNSRAHELILALQNPMVSALLQPVTPSLSAWESESQYMLKVDMPGVKKEDIDISFKGNLLSIHARRKSGCLENGFVPRKIETQSGTFFRAITLPVENHSSEISSQLEDGILTIIVPKQSVSGSKVNNKKSKAQ